MYLRAILKRSNEMSNNLGDRSNADGNSLGSHNSLTDLTKTCMTSSNVNNAGTCLYSLSSLVAHASDMKENSSANEKNEETVIWWQDSREPLWISRA